MKSRTMPALLALALLAAVSAYAGQFDIPYQNQLLARPLSAADQAFCSGKSGADFNACRVTRNYLADINNKAEKGFPPLADTKFARGSDEENKLIDRLPG